MTAIYHRSVINFKKNPKKTFFYDLKHELLGSDCLALVLRIIKFLKKNKITTMGISSKNTIYWPLWYLAADAYCKDLFIINSLFGDKLVDKLQKRYKIQYIAKNLDNLQNEEENINLDKFNDKFLNQRFVKKGQKNNIIFTSGSTGFPKGVIIPESAYFHVAKILIKKLNQKKDDLELLSMPFDHSFGLTRLRCVLISGSSALITEGLKNFPSIYKFSQTNIITGLSLVPSGIEIIKNLLKKKVNNFSKEINYFEIGSSAISEESRSWLKNNFKKSKIFHHYGTTEASRSFLRHRGNDDDFEITNNWIGEIIDDCEYMLDKQIGSVNKNQGELLIRGKNLFLEYLEQDDSKNKKKDDWFKTGDLCKEENSKVFLIGRLDNQLNVGGEKIQAEEIETIIEEFKEVKNCLCFQIPDKVRINKIICLIETNNYTYKQNLEKSILNIFNNYPNHYKQLTIKFLHKVPITNNGKKLRDQRELAKLLICPTKHL